MVDADLEKYCAQAVARGARDAKEIHPSSVVRTATTGAFFFILKYPTCRRRKSATGNFLTIS
ncbi:MAG: hypothetical protein JRI79_07790 [Deltaproteobacteria bacterium]|nr:hypothetical protein [Deltaproteobacteria bacterium]